MLKILILVYMLKNIHMNLKVVYLHSIKNLSFKIFSLTPLKALSDFNTGFKFLDTFYEVDVETCIKYGERSYKKYVNITHIFILICFKNLEKKFN
jgi:hypothetical protein